LTVCLPVATEKTKDGRICVLAADLRMPLAETPTEGLPIGVHVLSDAAFAKTIARRDPSGYLPEARWHVCLGDQETWHQLSNVASLTPINAQTVRTVDAYRVVSIGGEPITTRVITALRMARPTFLNARGELSIDAKSADTPLLVTGVTSIAMDRFTAGGACLNEGWATEIVLGKGDLHALGFTATSAVGRRIPFKISRTDAFGRNEHLSLSMSVIGVGERTCLSLDSVEQLVRWRKGEMEYIDGRFRTPFSIEIQRGATRAKIYVTSSSAVEAVASRFESQGYLVNHQIDEMRQLEELAKSLGNLTVLLCGSSLVLCGIVVIGHAYMSFAVKRTELDSLQSLGVSRLDTVKALLLEGMIFALMSLGLGLGAVAALGPFYGDAVCDAFRISRDTIRIGLLAHGGLEIAAASVVLALGYSLLGQCLPICAALCSKTAQRSAVFREATRSLP